MDVRLVQWYHLSSWFYISDPLIKYGPNYIIFFTIRIYHLSYFWVLF